MHTASSIASERKRSNEVKTKRSGLTFSRRFQRLLLSDRFGRRVDHIQLLLKGALFRLQLLHALPQAVHQRLVLMLQGDLQLEAFPSQLLQGGLFPDNIGLQFVDPPVELAYLRTREKSEAWLV